jgi:ectoine hydroxylase-related dioxygenase (phytanoyl-CoA dioxygenase family)
VSSVLGAPRAATDNEVLAICWRHLVVLEAAAHLLGPAFQAADGDLRDPEPGGGVQAFHPDGTERVPGLSATRFLDEFTKENGPTRLLPGTHLMSTRPAAAGRKDPVDGEVAAIGPAGSVLLRDARLYHGAARNLTSATRRACWSSSSTACRVRPDSRRSEGSRPSKSYVWELPSVVVRKLNDVEALGAKAICNRPDIDTRPPCD